MEKTINKFSFAIEKTRSELMNRIEANKAMIEKRIAEQGYMEFYASK